MPWSHEQTKKYRQDLRDQWIQKHGPCQNCGSVDRLEIDHIDPSTKKNKSLKTGKDIWVFHLSKAKREIELAKCQVLCYDCHKKKSAKERPKGEQLSRSRFTTNEVLEIRKLVKDKIMTKRELAKQYNVSFACIHYIIVGKTWAWLKDEQS